jgi:hypothetical protein
VERRLLNTVLFAGVSFAAAVGCAAPVVADTDAGNAQKLSVVEVRAWHAVADGSLNRLDAAARFVSVHEPGAPGDALELLGLAWPNITPGACTLVGNESAPASPLSVRVDLRDLSPVTLLLDSTPLHLEPRAFPDVAGLVSGVVFVAPSDPIAPLAGAKGVTLQVGQGAPAVSGLELPDLPSPLRLVDAVNNDGTFSIAGSGLDILATPARADDRVVVEVMRAGVVRARCGVDASGRLHLDSSALGGVGDATLVVRAQRRLLRDDALLDARLERAVEVKLAIH